MANTNMLLFSLRLVHRMVWKTVARRVFISSSQDQLLFFFCVLTVVSVVVLRQRCWYDVMCARHHFDVVVRHFGRVLCFFSHLVGCFGTYVVVCAQPASQCVGSVKQAIGTRFIAYWA